MNDRTPYTAEEAERSAHDLAERMDMKLRPTIKFWRRTADRMAMQGDEEDIGGALYALMREVGEFFEEMHDLIYEGLIPLARGHVEPVLEDALDGYVDPRAQDFVQGGQRHSGVRALADQGAEVVVEANLETLFRLLPERSVRTARMRLPAREFAHDYLHGPLRDAVEAGKVKVYRGSRRQPWAGRKNGNDEEGGES